MKHLITAFVTFLTAKASQISICSDCDAKICYRPYLKDESRFVQCQNGIEKILPCPEKTFWDNIHNGCTEKYTISTTSPSLARNRDVSWTLPSKTDPRPATSCHFWWKIPPFDMTKQWRLTNTVNVDLSTDSTYFCVVGFTPGGYAGIQEISPGNKVAIFSFWNDGSDSVSLIEQGAGVTVSTFGGEGTGLKSMKNFDWEVETDVTFTVIGKNMGPAPGSGSGKNIWRVACFYTYDNSGTWNFMAEYERTGADPVGTGGFYSFVEDWDRSNGAEGNLRTYPF